MSHKCVGLLTSLLLSLKYLSSREKDLINFTIKLSMFLCLILSKSNSGNESFQQTKAGPEEKYKKRE